MTNLITPRALFSHILVSKNHIRIGSDEPFQRYGHSKFSKMRGRSVVGRRSVVGPQYINCCHVAYSNSTLLRYFRNGARSKK